MVALHSMNCGEKIIIFDQVDVSVLLTKHNTAFMNILKLFLALLKETTYLQIILEIHRILSKQSDLQCSKKTLEHINKSQR